MAGFLITNELRNHIQGMPRGIRKQVIIEEMVSFLKVPNGAEIVVDYYQKMRKYSCQVTSVFQNYSTLLEASPKVAKAIVGNSSAMLLLRNHNRKDLDQLGEFMPRPLPEVIKDQITRFPKPAELAGDQAHSGFVYVRLDQEEPRFTVGRNYISQEVEEITNKPIPAGYNPSGIYVNHYACVKCRTRHFEDEDIYAKHIYWQSKHGIDSMSMEQRLEIVTMEQEGLER